MRRGLLATGLVVVTGPAPAVTNHTGPFPGALAAYRADRLCGGDSFEAVLAVIDGSLTAYHVADPAQPGISIAKGMLAAAQLDDLGATAYAKGCRVEATETWRSVVRRFDGPAFTAYRQRALAGLRALR